MVWNDMFYIISNSLFWLELFHAVSNKYKLQAKCREVVWMPSFMRALWLISETSSLFLSCFVFFFQYVDNNCSADKMLNTCTCSFKPPKKQVLILKMSFCSGITPSSHQSLIKQCKIPYGKQCTSHHLITGGQGNPRKIWPRSLVLFHSQMHKISRKFLVKWARSKITHSSWPPC